jgi:hypothetical protein
MKSPEQLPVVLLIVMLPLMSFINRVENKTMPLTTDVKKQDWKTGAACASLRYAYATSLEQRDGVEGLTTIVSNIVTVSCESANRYSVELQFNEHYNAELKTKYRWLYNGGGSTSGWIYASYDEAAISRRDYLAKATNDKKRTVSNFSFYCRN